MAKSYGNTWWGKSWLNALTQIDWDNRIPRGRRYANNGSVKAIQISGNDITAKVQGSRPQPYSVRIRVPKFTETESATLVDALRQDSGVYAALLNNELTPRINEVAEQKGLRVFPKTWSDLEMSCTCPDWAVPCKHIAAVIYLVTESIDRNPSQLFQMKGLDLKAAMEDMGVQQHSDLPPGLWDFFQEKFPKYYHETAPLESLRSLDLSKIPALRNPMYKLLAPKPLFWDGDFRDEWERRISSTTRNFDKWINETEAESLLRLPQLKRGYSVTLYLGPEMELEVVGLMAAQDSAPEGHALPELLMTLLALGPDDLPDMHPSVEALWQVANLSRVLLERGAIRAQLILPRRKGYRVLWFPADNAPEVARIMQVVEAAMPPDIVFIQDPRTSKESMLPAIPGKVGAILCHLFLEILIGEFSIDTPRYYARHRELFAPVPLSRDPVLDMFFGGMTVEFEGFGAESIAPTIQKWLSIFEVGSQKWKPILEVGHTQRGGFNMQVSLEDIRATGITIPTALSAFLSQPQASEDRKETLRALHLLAGVIPAIQKLLANGGKTPVEIDPQEILEVLLEKLPLIELLGIQTRLPKELKELVRPKLSMRIDTQSRSDASVTLGDIFDFDWRVAIGESLLTAAEFFDAVKTTHGLVMLKDRYVLIQPDELQRLRQRLERGARPGRHQLFQAALSGEFEGARVALTPEAEKLIQEITSIQALPIPAGIRAILRPYQQRGFEWMYKNARLGMGSVIADDMGLGKTMQVLCLLEQLRSEGKLSAAPALAVVPTSLLNNWKKEAERFAPELRMFVYHGPDRKLPKTPVDVMVTTYGIARTDLTKLKKLDWSLMVIDEAQNIKNPGTAQSKAVRELPASIHVAMSGTPVENRLMDYWSIMDFALPGYLGPQKEFRETYSNPITSYRDPDALRRFHLVTAPFIMRRVKTDPKVISDLPDKIIHNQWSSLTQEQAALYENIVQQSMAAIESSESSIGRQGLILKMLTALKQVCNHPAQYLGKGHARSVDSGKAETFLPLVESIVAQHEKCLIFTQYTEMATLIQRMLQEELGIEASFLHGGLNPKQREALVTEFQSDARRKVFILSLKAGGTGLNLTAANHVIHYDLWWNPAVENQATDRAFRIGQKKNVMVHRLICKGTLEERIDEMISSKKELADLAVGTGEKWIGELSNKDLRELVALAG